MVKLYLSQISYSPSCLRGSGNDTAMVEGSAEVALYQPFCMLPSLKHLPAGLAALVSHFNWQRAIVISEEDSHLIAVSVEPFKLIYIHIYANCFVILLYTFRIQKIFIVNC